MSLCAPSLLVNHWNLSAWPWLSSSAFWQHRWTFDSYVPRGNRPIFGKKNNVMEFFKFLDSLASFSSSGFDFWRKLIPLHRNQYLFYFQNIGKIQNWNFLSLSKVMGLWNNITKIQYFRKFSKTNADVSKFSYNFRVSLCFSVEFNVLFKCLILSPFCKLNTFWLKRTLKCTWELEKLIYFQFFT